jgi:hypothetical protein
VYFALGAISRKTLVSEAAASTVGRPPAAFEAPLDPVLEDRELVLLLLPQAASAAAAPIANTAVSAGRSRLALNTTRSSSTLCQNPGSIP